MVVEKYSDRLSAESTRLFPFDAALLLNLFLLLHIFHTLWLLRESTRNLLTWAGMSFYSLFLFLSALRLWLGVLTPPHVAGWTHGQYKVLTFLVTRPRPALRALLERIWYDSPFPCLPSVVSRS